LSDKAAIRVRSVFENQVAALLIQRKL